MTAMEHIVETYIGDTWHLIWDYTVWFRVAVMAIKLVGEVRE